MGTTPRPLVLWLSLCLVCERPRALLLHQMTMSTHGFVGFKSKGKQYRTYNRMDSYKMCLGANTVDILKRAVKEEHLDFWRDMVDNLVEVSEQTPPTEEEQELLAEYCDGESGETWYDLLRRTQGRVDLILNCGHILNDPNLKVGDDLMIEYGYVVDLDEERLEYFEDKGDGDVEHSTYPFTDLPPWDELEPDPDWGRNCEEQMMKAFLKQQKEGKGVRVMRLTMIDVGDLKPPGKEDDDEEEEDDDD